MLIFFGFSLWRGSFLLLLLVSRDVSSFLLSSLGFFTRVLSALRPSLVRPFEFTCGVLRICSVCCTHAWFVFGVAGIQYALAIFLFGGETSSPSRCHRRTASSVWRAAHCTVHRGQPPLRRHRSVSTLVEASGLCCRGCRLITSRSACKKIFFGGGLKRAVFG